MRLLAILRKPHPFIFKASSVLLPGIVTLIILLLLAPFGFDKLDITYRLQISFAIATIASFSALVGVLILKKINPTVETQWTVGKEIGLILAIVVIIAWLIFLFFQAFNLTQLEPGALFRAVFLKTLAISVLPIIILVLFEQYQHQKRQVDAAQKLNEALSSLSQESTLMQLFGENGNVELQLKSSELFYMKAEGNYVEVHYFDRTLQKRLIRNRLKKLADSLPKDQFFHCHKSYVVNPACIVSVEGNARNFMLKIRNAEQLIPVSRSKSDKLKQLIKS